MSGDLNTNQRGRASALSLPALKPHLTMIVLECTDADSAEAFGELVRFLDMAAESARRAV